MGRSDRFMDRLRQFCVLDALMAFQAIVRLLESFLWHVRLQQLPFDYFITTFLAAYNPDRPLTINQIIWLTFTIGWAITILVYNKWSFAPVTDDNKWSFGQTMPLALLILPIIGIYQAISGKAG